MSCENKDIKIKKPDNYADPFTREEKKRIKRQKKIDRKFIKDLNKKGF